LRAHSLTADERRCERLVEVVAPVVNQSVVHLEGTHDRDGCPLVAAAQPVDPFGEHDLARDREVLDLEGDQLEAGEDRGEPREDCLAAALRLFRQVVEYRVRMEVLAKCRRITAGYRDAELSDNLLGSSHGRTLTRVRPCGRVSDMARSRQRVLDRATHRASALGLDGLSLGVLAVDVGMSKSGVAGLFASKAELQIATIVEAERVFFDRVFRSVPDEPGLPRLKRIFDRWLGVYLGHFEGGCFFAAAASELDDRPPGPVREALAAALVRMRRELVGEIRLTQRLGGLSVEIDPVQLAFELHAFVQEANYLRRMYRDDSAIESARRAITNRLAAVS